MCGGALRLRQSETVVHVPGNPTPSRRTEREWVCPECDYYEEAEEEET